MPKGYTDIDTIQNYLLVDIGVSFTDQIDDWISSVEAYIDKQTGRNFIADATASARLYDGHGESELLVDDFVSMTELTIDETEVETADRFLYPTNTTPKNKIRLVGARFTQGNQNVSVTAKWGYSIICPYDIKHVATILVAGIIGTGDKQVRSETIGNYSVTYSNKGWKDYENVKNILDSYRKFTF